MTRLGRWRSIGYSIHIIYLWLRSADLAVERVRERVRSGGHNVPEEIVRRRYDRSLSNFFQFYMPLADKWVFYDNSYEKPELAAEKTDSGEIRIRIPELWKWTEQSRNKLGLGGRLTPAIQAGVAKAIAEHKAAGRSIAISRNGKVVIVPPPEEIVVPRIREHRKT